MFAFQQIAEAKIQEGIKNGAFDNLSCKGKKLDFKEENKIPEDLRMAYKILKNANFVPPEIELEKEIRKLNNLIDQITDEDEKCKKIKMLNKLIMKFNILSKRKHISLQIPQRYYDKFKYKK